MFESTRRSFLAACGSLLAWQSAARSDDLSDAEETAFRAALDRVAPCTVRIETIGGREKIEKMLVGEGPTTGLILTEDGYIVSSSFNFAHDPASILVTLPSGKRAAAKITARDRARMLVLLKVTSEEKLPVPQIAPREELRVGQYAIAVGRTLEGSRPRLSAGVVSALERVSGRALQTDAKISPANYGGPLIDLEGRVLGVLTPLDPNSNGEVSGAEWYDSGIGFAAHLSDWLTRLDRLKEGKDLVPGVLGVSMKRGDPYVSPAEVSVSRLHGPAHVAGIREGDRIVRLGKKTITRQMELREALGAYYAGDTIEVAVVRNDERREFKVELIDKLEPYEYPFLGVLPESQGTGVTVRYVFPDSPAAKLGLKIGDRLLKAGDHDIRDLAPLHDLLAAHDPAQPLTLAYDRSGEQAAAELKLGKLGGDVPRELPALVVPPAKAEVRVKPGTIELKLDEEKHQCFAYVPATYRDDSRHALLVWFAPPGKFAEEDLAKRWKEAADAHGTIVLAPRPGEQGKWQADEVAVVRKFLDLALAKFAIDRSRIAVHGIQAGGSMAWLTALNHRDLVRGIAVAEAPLNPRIALENDPMRRLFVLSGGNEKSPLAPALKETHERLKNERIPSTVRTRNTAGEFTSDETADLMRWLDCLARI